MDKKEKKNKKKDNQSLKILKIYLVPLLSLGLFIGVVVFFIFPLITQIIDDFAFINELTTEIENKNAELLQLQRIEQNIVAIRSQRDFVNAIAPEAETEVVVFRNRLTNLATENNLTIVSQRYSESVDSAVQNSSQSTPGLQLKEVPSFFEFEGSFEDIENFIADLNELEDFVVVSQMNLTGGSLTRWNFDMNIIKYQFNEASSDELEGIYLSISPFSELNPIVEEYILIKQ